VNVFEHIDSPRPFGCRSRRNRGKKRKRRRRRRRAAIRSI